MLLMNSIEYLSMNTVSLITRNKYERHNINDIHNARCIVMGPSTPMVYIISDLLIDI